jgi:histidyl-tRNA synthetase
MLKDIKHGQAVMKVFITAQYGKKLEHAKPDEIVISLNNLGQVEAIEEIIDGAANEEELSQMLEKIDSHSQELLIKEVAREKKKRELIKAIAVNDGIRAKFISKKLGIKEFKNLKNLYQQLSIEQLSSCKLTTTDEKEAFFDAVKNKVETLKVMIEASIKKNKAVLEIFHTRYNEFSEDLKAHIKIRQHHLGGFFAET